MYANNYGGYMPNSSPYYDNRAFPANQLHSTPYPGLTQGAYQYPGLQNPMSMASNKSVMQRLQDSRAKAAKLRQEIQRNKLRTAQSILSSKHNQSYNAVQECIAKVEHMEQKQRDKLMDDKFTALSNQSLAVMELLHKTIESNAQSNSAPPRESNDTHAMNKSFQKQQQTTTMPNENVANHKSVEHADELDPVDIERKELLSELIELKKKETYEKLSCEFDYFKPEDQFWTDEDQRMLDGDIHACSSDEEDEIKPTEASSQLQKEQQEKDKTRQRRQAISKKFGLARKPRWRFGDQDTSGLASSIMKPKEIFRSTAITIIFCNVLRKMYVSKKKSTKHIELCDTANALNIYFDGTRVWLAKTVKLPIASVLQDKTLNFDLIFAKQSGLFGSKGKKASEAAFVKLKVRIRGIFDAIFTTAEKQEMPMAISNCLNQITTDGVYFPSNYLFAVEKLELEFDQFGGTMSMQGAEVVKTKKSIEEARKILLDDDKERKDKDSGKKEAQSKDEDPSTSNITGESNTNVKLPHERPHRNAAFQYKIKMIISNFVFTRILIPHVILQPWTCNIGPKPSKKHISRNLSIIASIVFMVLEREFTLFEAGVAAPQDNKKEANTIKSLPVKAEPTAVDENLFFTPAHISSQLIPSKYFTNSPLASEINAFIAEMQTRLSEWLKYVLPKVEQSKPKKKPKRQKATK